MKKILLLIISIILLSGCNKYNEYTQINYEELQKKLDNKDSFVLVVGSSTCSACSKYKTTMEKVIKDKDIEIFYIDLNSLTTEEKSKLYSKFVVNSTPTTIFIKNGIEESTYNRIVGAAGYSEIIDKLEKMEFIGE